MKFTIPNSINEARNLPQWTQWLGAYRKEIKLYRRELVFEPVHISEVDKPVLDAHWKFDVTTNEKGSHARFEAKLYIKGNDQIKGVHYDETYSPTVSYETLKLVLASVAATGGQRVYQFRINNCYLQGSVDRYIYVNPPPGIEIKDDHVWSLDYCMPGMKQASRQWYLRIKGLLKDNGFSESSYDPGLFCKDDCYIMLYSDIVIVAGMSVEHVESFLKKQFSMEYLTYEYHNEVLPDVVDYHIGEERSSKILGMNMNFNDRGITLTMKDAITRAVQEHNISIDPNSPCTPLPLCFEINNSGSSFLDRNGIKEFKSILGKLIFIQSKLRDDITQPVKYLRKASSKPTASDLRSAKQVLYYLGYTSDSGVSFDYLPMDDEDDDY